MTSTKRERVNSMELSLGVSAIAMNKPGSANANANAYTLLATFDSTRFL